VRRTARAGGRAAGGKRKSDRLQQCAGQEDEAVARKLKSDKVLFITAMLLVCVSIVMVYSASARVALTDDWGDRYHFVTKQTLWAVLGIATLAVAMRIDYRAYRNDAFIYGLVGAVAFLLVAVFLTDSVKGAHRWLNVGGLGIQPSEFAKIVCVLFTAMILERRMHRIDEPGYALLPIAIVVGALLVLIWKEPDFGTTASLLLVVAVMIFAAGLHYKHLITVALTGLPLFVIALISATYRMRRLTAFFSSTPDTRGDGYQAYQSMLAVASGGLFGRGLSNGVQKLGYVPEAPTDFIFAVIGEELGIIGATGILICFCVITWRGLRIALRAEDQFGAFIATGLTTMLCAQALINMSVVLRMMPTKGIPLPLVSFGGSSLLVSLLAVGMLLNISQHAVTAEA
jgi:cell division protein FtsW